MDGPGTRSAAPGPGRGQRRDGQQAAAGLGQVARVGEGAEARLGGAALVGDGDGHAGEVAADLDTEAAAGTAGTGVPQRVDGQLVQHQQHILHGREVGQQAGGESPDGAHLGGLAGKDAPPIHGRGGFDGKGGGGGQRHLLPFRTADEQGRALKTVYE